MYDLSVRLLCLLSFAILAALGAPPEPAIPLKVQDRFVPAPYEAQRIEGMLGERMKINLEKRLLNIEEDALLAGFRNRPGNHPWIGEHIGKYLHAAANTYRYTKNTQLKAQMDRMALELIKTQMPDGYLGTYADAERWTSWDVWSHKYDLIGLMAWYEVTGDERALAACRKIGDLLYATFVAGGRDIIASSTHVGMAATSALEGIVTLYRYSGDPKHLALAEHIVKTWEQPNGPKLMSSLTGPSPNVYKTGNAKAYEMMSDLVGLVELYRVTGKPEYLAAARNAQADIAERRRYLTGTTSTHEHFQDDFVLPGETANDVGEGCATVTWLQLNWQLLRVTGDARYAEELEATIFNQLIAAQEPETGNICYFTPINGRKRPRTDINCCRSSEPRGISMIPSLVWGELPDGLVMWQFVPGEVTMAGWSVKSQTVYPMSGEIVLNVSSTQSGERTLYLRMPRWAARMTVDGNAVGSVNGMAAVTRDWSGGRTVKVAIDMTPRWADGGKSYPGFAAAEYGPLVLALDRGSNPSVPYLQRTSIGENPRLSVRGGRFGVKGEALQSDGSIKKQDLALVPFADARDYRIWLNKGPVSKQLPVSLAIGERELMSSRDGRFHAALTDENTVAERRTRPRQDEGFDFYGVEFDAPATIAKVRFHQGSIDAEGGWFEGKPEVQVQREARGNWETVAVLASYPDSKESVKAGASYEAALPQPQQVTAVRIRGKRGGAYTSCTEFEVLP